MSDHLTMAASSSNSIITGCEMIHEDVVFQILLRLPVASLLRFKSVCKSWLSLIRSSTFISRHSNLEDNQENILAILDNPLHGHTLISVFDLQFSNHVDFKLNTDETICAVELIASFNGIVCLAHKLIIAEFAKSGSNDEQLLSLDRMYVVSVWNPATKHVNILPPSLFNNRLVPRLDYCSINYGFGFDVKTNDYKVVKVIMEELAFGSKVSKSHAEVYSLNMDCWRVIDAAVPLNILVKSYPKRPSQNGLFYWLGWDSISQGSSILSFDFSNEVFGIIPALDDYKGYQVLDFLREKLACIHMVPNSSESGDNHCTVWMLDKCGVKDSWTKLYTIMLEPHVCPMGFSVNGKMILKKKVNGGADKLILFDPAVQEFNDTSSQGTFCDLAFYKESLVSVKGATGETYRVDSKWKTTSSTWDLTVSQIILASNEKFARLFDQDASSLVIFDEPKTVLHLPAQTILPTC